MEIKSISQRIFRTASNNSENRSKQTNPFGVSIEGNVINADVFFSGAKESIAQKASNKSKMIMSTIVGSFGSFGSFNQKISNGLNTVIKLGRTIKEQGRIIREKTSAAWNYLNETNVESLNLSEKLSGLNLPEKRYGVKNLLKLNPQEDLEPMFNDLVALKVRGEA